MLAVYALWASIFAVGTVLANTEIINFAVNDASDADLPFANDWLTLSPDNPHALINATSAPSTHTFHSDVMCQHSEPAVFGSTCQHELWMILDFDQTAWKDFHKFTFRVSWPAFQPTDLALDVFDPLDLKQFASKQSARTPSTTRRKYARVRLVHHGVLTPGRSDIDALEKSRYDVRLSIVVEPLHFGLLPSSVIPVVAAIACIIALGIPASKRINSYLQSIVADAEEKLLCSNSKKKT